MYYIISIIALIGIALLIIFQNALMVINGYFVYAVILAYLILIALIIFCVIKIIRNRIRETAIKVKIISKGDKGDIDE